MPREHARVKLSIWEDPDFRQLPVDAQHLYFFLLTSLKLDYAGVTDWRPGRIAAHASDWTPPRVEAAAQILSERLYVVIDEPTEEVLLRSFIRHDGLMEQPNLAVAMRKAHAAVASATLRAVVIHELDRLYKEKPDLKGWARVLDMLEMPSMNPSDNPSFRASVHPSDDPSGKGSDDPSVGRTPNPSTHPSDDPSPTTAPNSLLLTPAPNSMDTTKRRRTQIDADWKPSENDIEWQRAEGIPDAVARRELPAFRDHWISKGEVRADWSATWRNWLRRSGDYSRTGNAAASSVSSGSGGVQPWER